MSGGYDLNYVWIWPKIDLLLLFRVVLVLYHRDFDVVSAINC